MKECIWNEEFGTGGKINCVCDNCNKSVKFSFSSKPSYKDAHAKLKKKGWVARQISGKWYDFCSQECFDDFYKNDKYMED